MPAVPVYYALYFFISEDSFPSVKFYQFQNRLLSFAYHACVDPERQVCRKYGYVCSADHKRQIKRVLYFLPQPDNIIKGLGSCGKPYNIRPYSFYRP